MAVIAAATRKFCRYVPLIAWAIAILLIFVIPLKIIGDLYLPVDDALRHAAKAVSGKSWSDIVILRQPFHVDPEYGWGVILRQVYLWTHFSADKLVVVSVVTLFCLVGWSALACMRRPEALFGSIIVLSLTTGLTSRLMFGRPFIVTMTAMIVILLQWYRSRGEPPKWRSVTLDDPLDS